MVIFSFSSVIGFACSIGIKLGYNNHHHEKSIANTASSCHDSTNENDNKNSQHPFNNNNDDCCSNGVKTFILLDKENVNTVSFLHPVFSTSFVVSPFILWPLPTSLIPKNIRAFAQSYHPPISDLRIAIQSFQI